MNRIQIIVLVALLAGCASAPQLKSEANVSDDVSTQPVASVHEADTQKPVTQVQVKVIEIDPKTQQCLAEVMYWEARGEGRQGMVAVASVVFNRAADKRFPDSVCGVVYQGGETPPCQFSWWCDGKADRPTNQLQWAETLDLAGTLLTVRPADPTEGALFYHNTSIRDPWQRPLIARIGNHIFYR